MQSNEIRTRFLKFFENRGHKIIPSASLVPENDPSVLFNTAGMQPLVPYLLGQVHPMGNRIVDVQKCVRTGDLEEIGDNTHFSFFEMLGNWSLGDYFKKEAITWSYEFLTNGDNEPEGDRGLGLDVNRLYVTIFEGDENAPYDQESKDIWMSLGIPEHRIYALSAKDNWWSAGDNGPCGPDSEMFYDLTDDGLGNLTKEEFLIKSDEQKVVEIWNDVFMEYEKKDGKVIGKLKQKNVDTGAGLERLTAVMQGKTTAYDTDLFEGAMNIIKESVKEYDEKYVRVIADHIRASVFMIADGVLPSKKNQGYVLRRLIRRAVFKMKKMDAHNVLITNLVKFFIDKYGDVYQNLKQTNIQSILKLEEEKFLSNLEGGSAEFEKGTDPFVLFTTYGFPIELTLELAKEKGQEIDMEDFKKKMEEHQKLSQTASAGMFKGGLANHNEQTVRLHTAHHLLLAALRQVIGDHVYQRGSNITGERLRIDFAHTQKMTPEEKDKVEGLVNKWIQESLPMTRVEIPREQAEQVGAQMEFGAKYPDMVSVYYVGENLENAVSKEFCGGPHIKNTSELGTFKILKEESVAAGIRRIKAILQ